MKQVRRSKDLVRIAQLPRRVWEPADKQAVVPLLTNEYRKPAGKMTLRPDQAAALCDMHDAEGGVVLIRVGGGKTLVGALVPTVLNARRPVLFVPASTREQTRDDHRLLRKHWDVRSIRVESHDFLSQKKNKQFLFDFMPDLIVLDEGQTFGDPTSVRSKVIKRYLKQHGDVPVVVMSGTLTDYTILRYAHILQWTLGKDGAPVPIEWRELHDWACAIDENVRAMQRMGPGALTIFSDGVASIRAVRQGFSKRLTETPGVYATEDIAIETKLVIRRRRFKVPEKIASVLDTLINKWEDPDGNPVFEAKDHARMARQLSLGFWYRWKKPGPKHWMNARRDWGRWVTSYLQHNRRQLDSPGQIWSHCEALAKTQQRWEGMSESERKAWKQKHKRSKPEAPPFEFLRWRDVKDDFEPETVCFWLSSFALEHAAEWMEKHKGIVWTLHRAFGPALAKLTGRRYFGPGKADALAIMKYRGGRPIIASVQAHGTGRDRLQYRWHKNLFVSAFSSGKRWEQVLGRTHRPGQKAETVYADVWLHTPPLVAAFDKALGRARYLEDTLRNKQKLNYATFE